MRMLLLFLVCLLPVTGRLHAQNTRLHVKLAILPSLRSLFNDQEINITTWHSGNTQSMKKVLINVDTASVIITDTGFVGLMVHCQVKSGPFEHHYFLYHEPGKLIPGSSDTIRLQFPPDCAYNRQGIDNRCPKCRKTDKVLPILYGLRVPLYDEAGNILDEYRKYRPGGCSVSDCDPGWYCQRDELSF